MTISQPSLADWAQRRLKLALRCAIAAALGSFGFSLLNTNHLDLVPIADTLGLPFTSLTLTSQSISSTFIYLTLSISLVVVAISFRRLARYDPTVSALERQAAAFGSEWIGRLAVSLIVGVLLFGISLGVMLLVVRLFEGATLTRLGVVILATGYGGGLAFGLAFWAVTLKTRQILTLVGVFLIGAFIFAMWVSSDRLWWQRSLSALGHDSIAGLVFNLSLIFAGLAALAVALEEIDMLRLLRDSGTLTWQGYRVLQVSLVGICVLMIGIGLFPTTISPLSDFLHNVAANGMIGLIVLLMFTVTIFAPIFPQHFKAISTGFGVLCSLLLLLYVLRVLSFVAMELLLISICGVWMFYFKTQTEAYARRLELSGAAQEPPSLMP